MCKQSLLRLCRSRGRGGEQSFRYLIPHSTGAKHSVVRRRDALSRQTRAIRACAVRIAEALCSPSALAKGGKISNVKEAANKQGAGPKMICVIEPMVGPVFRELLYSTQRMAC